MSSDKEILALEDKRYAAMCGGDFAALEAMLHDELLYTHSSGLTDTKATWLASLRSGKTKYKSAACSDRKVRLAGDTALVTGRAAIQAEINGQPRSLRLVFLNAWTKTPNGWKFIAWQSTPQPTTNQMGVQPARVHHPVRPRRPGDRMKFLRRTFLHLAAGAAALPALSRIARAQAYPSRPVRIISGFPPGGVNDTYARLIGQWLSERLGQQFFVDNLPAPVPTIPPRS